MKAKNNLTQTESTIGFKNGGLFVSKERSNHQIERILWIEEHEAPKNDAYAKRIKEKRTELRGENRNKRKWNCENQMKEEGIQANKEWQIEATM